MAWLLAVLAGGCNAGTALAGKAAERSRCRPAAYGLVVFVVAGLAESDPSRSNRADAGDGRPSPGARRALLVVVFAANGLLMLGYKLFGVTLPAQPSASLVAATYGCGALLAAVVQASRGALRVSRAEFGWGLGAGTATSLAALALLGSMQLPAAVAFPVVQGTSLAGGVFLCALVFRERLTPRKLAALAAGLGAMVLTLWR